MTEDECYKIHPALLRKCTVNSEDNATHPCRGMIPPANGISNAWDIVLSPPVPLLSNVPHRCPQNLITRLFTAFSRTHLSPRLYLLFPLAAALIILTWSHESHALDFESLAQLSTEYSLIHFYSRRGIQTTNGCRKLRKNPNSLLSMYRNSVLCKALKDFIN